MSGTLYIIILIVIIVPDLYIPYYTYPFLLGTSLFNVTPIFFLLFYVIYITYNVIYVRLSIPLLLLFMYYFIY